MKVKRFEDLECWKEAREIVNRVYKVCRVDGFKKDYTLNKPNKLDKPNELEKLDKP